MSLQTRRPPGHAKRKALSYTADIDRLRAEGHTYSAIREALEDAGVSVSISTVRREVLKSMSKTAIRRGMPLAIASQGSLPTDDKLSSRAPAPLPAAGMGTTPLPGKAIAEEFMRGRSTNPLFLEEPLK